MAPYWPFRTGLKIGSLDANCDCIETLPHIGFHESHMNTCYYHQDLYYRTIQTRSLFVSFVSVFTVSRATHMLTGCCQQHFHNSRRLYVCTLAAPLIFKAIAFARWVFTHSLADSNFHGHCPGVFIQQRFLWYLMSVQSGTFKTAFGSSRITYSAYQKMSTNRKSHCYPFCS